MIKTIIFLLVALVSQMAWADSPDAFNSEKIDSQKKTSAQNFDEVMFLYRTTSETEASNLLKK